MTHRSYIRKGERSSSDVASSQLPRRSQRLQPVELHGDFEDAEHLDVLHVRNQETLGGVHRQSDVMSSLNRPVLNNLTQNESKYCL